MMSFEAIDTRIDLERAVQAIDNIRQREVARLSIIGYTDKDISNRIGMTVKGVGEMRRRARIKIRHSMQGYYPL